MNSPDKLELLVQQHYEGSAEKLVEAAERMQGYLQELQTQKLEGPRIQYHNLRSVWPEERYEEFNRLAKVLFRWGSFPEISEVKRGILYREDKNTLSATPLSLPITLVSAGSVGYALAAAYGNTGSLGELIISVVSVAALTIGISAFEILKVGNHNTFERVGKHLVSQARRYQDSKEVSAVLLRTEELLQERIRKDYLKKDD